MVEGYHVFIGGGYGPDTDGQGAMIGRQLFEADCAASDVRFAHRTSYCMTYLDRNATVPNRSPRGLASKIPNRLQAVSALSVWPCEGRTKLGIRDRTPDGSCRRSGSPHSLKSVSDSYRNYTVSNLNCYDNFPHSQNRPHSTQNSVRG